METTGEKLKTHLTTLYANKGEDDVTITVDEFFSAREGWKPNETIKNFVAKISIDDTAKNTEKPLTDYTYELLSKGAFVRPWIGDMPSFVREVARDATRESNRRTKRAQLD